MKSSSKKRRRKAGRGEGAVVQCPSCFEQIQIAFDSGGTSEQSFPYDCEVCCRPMVVHLSRDSDGEISGTAERES